mgnify:CR=1 FL=1
MSRSNPNKRKHREARKTAQIVVEGFTEEAFCKYLKSEFARDCGISVEIHNSRGSSPMDIVHSALKRPGFDRTLVVYDTDLDLPEVWAAKARSAGHEMVPSTPCIEALFLEILGERVPANTGECKRAFSKHMTDQQKCEYRSYGKVFSKELLIGSSHSSIKCLLSVFGL